MSYSRDYGLGVGGVLMVNRLGLTDFMRGKMVEKLQELERQIKQNS